MTATELITAVTIHLVIPLIGLLVYFGPIRKMKREEVDKPPIIDLFLIFATYGGLLLVTLTTFFWEWSGMASLGTFYLILGAPIVMGIIAFRNYKTKKLSKYHIWIYKLGLLYFAIAPLTIITTIILE